LPAFECAHVAQLVERILGKDEVHRFDPGRGLLDNAQGSRMKTIINTVHFFINQGVFHGKGKV
jgi:hypothetical protein